MARERKSNAERQAAARAAGRLRPRLERLESRCVLSADLPYFTEIVADLRESGANFDANFDEGPFIAAFFSGGDARGDIKFDLSLPHHHGHFGAIGPVWPGFLPGESGSSTLPDLGLGEGGFVDFGAPETFVDPGGMGAADSGPAASGVNSMLSTLNNQPDSLRVVAYLNVPGMGGLPIFAPANSLTGQTTNARSTGDANAANRSEPGAAERPANADSAKAPLDDKAEAEPMVPADADSDEGGMVALAREVVLDPEVDAEAIDIDAEQASTPVLRMKGAYGRFQAFEVSTSERMPASDEPAAEKKSPEPGDAAAAEELNPPTGVMLASRVMPITATMLGASVADWTSAVDYLMAISDSAREFVESAKATAQASAETEASAVGAGETEVDQPRADAETSARASRWLPLGSAAAAALFATAAGVTRKPFGRGKPKPER